MRKWPATRPGKSNLPDSSVQLTQVLFASVFVRRTIAEGTGTPSGVLTVPDASEPEGVGVLCCTCDCVGLGCWGRRCKPSAETDADIAKSEATKQASLPPNWEGANIVVRWGYFISELPFESRESAGPGVPFST